MILQNGEVAKTSSKVLGCQNLNSKWNEDLQKRFDNELKFKAENITGF